MRAWPVITWCAVLGVTAVAAGGHDAVKGTEINVRLVGALVFAAGIVLIAGALGLRGRQPRGRALAMIAALVGVTLGVLMSLTQVANDEPDERLAIWTTMIVLSALAAYQVRRLSTSEERAEGVWSHLPVLKSAISLGVVISIGQFWYSSVYLPTTAPASAVLETKIERVTEAAGQLVVSGTVTIRSNSDARINLLASVLELRAESNTPSRLDREAWQERIRDADRSLGALQATRYESNARLTRVHHQRLVSDGSYLEPGEVITVPVLAQIPKNQYNTLVLDAYVAMARGKVLGLENAPDPEPSMSNDNVVISTEVPNDGLLQNVTRGDRFLRVEYDSNADSVRYPTIQFVANRRSKLAPDFNERLHRFYGTSVTTDQAYARLPEQ